MKGNGEFTGSIYATDGQFTGTINALEGSLGNLSVNGAISVNDKMFINAIATEDKPYTGIYSSNYFKDENSGFYISDNGTIIANQLTLGTSANIKKYIKLGENSWIINPSWLNNELSKENPEKVVINNNLKQDSFITIKDNSSQDLLNIKQNGIITIGKNSGIRIDGNTVLFQDSSDNGNDFTNEYAVNFSVNEEEGYVLYSSGKVYSPENMIKGSFTLNFIMCQNNLGVGYDAMFNLLNDESVVLGVSQYADQNPYIKICDFNNYGTIAGADYWGTDEINEYTYVFDYDTHYVIVYKNGIKITEVYHDYLSTDYLSGTTKFM